METLLRKSLATTQSRLGFILLIVIGTLLTGVTVASAQLPSGERQLGQTIIEPGYDDRTGNLIYIMTPIGTPNPSHANAHAVSPLFLIVRFHRHSSKARESLQTRNNPTVCRLDPASGGLDSYAFFATRSISADMPLCACPS